MMSRVFNSPLEISLRVLILLSVKPDKRHSVDEVTARDFMASYAEEFGILSQNINGDNEHKFEEYALRRKLIDKSLRSLSLKGLIDFTATEDGFEYCLNESGFQVVSKLQSEYAENYRTTIAQVDVYTTNMETRQIIETIMNKPIGTFKMAGV
jgi:hypothetical protein